MPRDRLEEVLDELGRVRKDPHSPASLATLRRVLGRESSHAVARAALIVAESQLDALVPDLVAAFQRFLDVPARRDAGCAAKKAVASALLRLDHADDGVLRAGIAHVQLEPVWGGQVDTAVDLRGTCALGLARTSGSEVPELLGELLADPEPPARVSAARALLAHGGLAALSLLRHKALAGDEEPRVVVECLVGLLQLDPARSLPFASRLLQPRPVPGQPPRDRAECAAQALGESRLKEAFPLLRDFYPEAVRRRLGATALRAIAALRRDEGFDFLMSLLREADLAAARDALAALAEARDASLDARLREAVADRGDLAGELARVLADRDRQR